MRISDWSSDVCSSDLIEAAKDIDSRVDQVGNFTFLAYVCAEETRFPAGLANGSHDLFASLFIATRHHDTSAFSCKANRTSATAARCRSGDERYLFLTARSDERRVGNECVSTC